MVAEPARSLVAKGVPHSCWEGGTPNFKTSQRSEIELQHQLNQSRIVACGSDAAEVAEDGGVDDMAGVRINVR